ncbi:MAG: radical SAM protein, partial [Alphaproteobacteria bacterium]|nr:radical SAM protein [Alphaproteobacteria bacterium]
MEKFSHPTHTATGETRAWIDLRGLTTLWFNTGTLCNLTCANCYIESSPRNDSLVYLTAEEVNSYLDEIAQDKLPTQEIGFTGGEPFMNPDIIPMIESCLERGFSVLVLTNAMKPMMRCKSSLLALNQRYHAQLTLRISIDHFSPELHEEERGKNTWQPMIDGVQWLVENNFTIDIAGRTRWNDDMDALRQGYAALFNRHKIPVDAQNAKQLMLFPEMDPQAEVPEITTKC